ncbi:hypothetical protein HK097_010252 [Rhizophlyctis rosea]|uniref:Rho-GAP domain-containing protein n=1 Tax=Rhizophlyctis rosea TaxID=64517 RepID=A0AAD5S9G8_9FUNG|nr:hypothetical protein HK097_010252 [Rhizophlyctis rosea]
MPLRTYSKNPFRLFTKPPLPDPKPLYGSSLDELLGGVSAETLDGVGVVDEVPKVVRKCVEIVQSPEVINTVGLYMTDGMPMAEDMVDRYIQEEPLIRVNSLAIASYLKKLLASLPGDCDKLASIHFHILASLPPTHLPTYKLLLSHLHKVSTHHHKNSMHPWALAYVFSPIFFPPSATGKTNDGHWSSVAQLLMSHFIENWDELEGTGESDSRGADTTGTTASAMPLGTEKTDKKKEKKKDKKKGRFGFFACCCRVGED